MQTLYEFGMEVTRVREAIDSIEVRGHEERFALVEYAFNKCNDIIAAINSVVQQQNQNGEEGARDLAEEGDMNGEQDSAATGITSIMPFTEKRFAVPFDAIKNAMTT